MRIEKILPPGEKTGQWTLGLEGGKLLRVTEGEMIDFALYAGMELEPATLLKLEAAAKHAALRDRAVSLLTRGLCSKGELITKLKTKGAGQAQAEQIALWAEEIGLLNELEYARSIVRHYGAKGYGAYKIKDELYRRKVPKDLWEDALEERTEPEEAIDAYLRKHVTSRDPKILKKASDALARRGFSWSEISQGIERLEIDAD